MNRAPEPARRQPSRSLIDWDNAPDFQRLRRFFLCSIFGVAGVAQNFELWLNHLQLASALVLLYFAVQGDHLARHKLILQIGGIEKQAAQAGPALSHCELENRHLASAEKP